MTPTDEQNIVRSIRAISESLATIAELQHKMYQKQVESMAIFEKSRQEITNSLKTETGKVNN